MRRRIAFAGTVVVLIVAACSPSDSPDAITLLVHDSFAEAVTDDTFAAFTDETGITVVVLAAGDAGAMVNQAILAKGNPFADVLFGIDDTFLSRALDEGIFQTYRSGESANVFPEFVDTRHRVTPIDYGDVCINYDKEWFESTKLALPDSLDELRANLYASHLTVQHPATSSPGLAFMLATIAEFGEDGWLRFWAGLRDGGVNVTADWTSAYYGNFTPHGGESSMVVSYATSPPAEVIFAAEPTDEPPTGVIEAGCYRQVEYAAVLAGTDHPEAAGQLIDFMLSVRFQETIPSNWFVYPVNRNAEVPAVFRAHSLTPASPARLSATYIADNRDRWIDEWIQVMEG